MNHEITYERTVAGSYMKIMSRADAGLDERLILMRKLPGTLPMEKVYVNGCGQYWYNISGRQSLDTYCKVKEVGIDLIEKLAVSLCSELDILERNLVRADCLLPDPEFIFITNANQEFIFTLYPCSDTQVEPGFQRLMEYLLTKINHRDEAAVRAAYGIYEITLREGYSIMDIRSAILKARQEAAPQETDMCMTAETIQEKRTEEVRKRQKLRIPDEADRPGDHTEPKKEPHCKKRRTADAEKKNVWTRLFEGIKAILGYSSQASVKSFAYKDNAGPGSRTGRRNREKRLQKENLVYPDEEIYMPKEEIHPTVCLGGSPGILQGILLYQGTDAMQDIRIENDTVSIGYGREADVRIADDTVSQMHARIDREGGSYYIEDLNSTNGTYVNDRLLVCKERHKLQANDVVRFANLRYRFC